MVAIYIGVLAVALSFVPVISRYLSLINTFIHESGHAIMTLVTGGKNRSISLFKNGGGLAIGGTTSSFARFLVLLSGYTSSSASGFGIFYLLLHEHVRLVFFLFVGLIVINVVFWIRNFFGLLWILSFLGVFFLLYKYVPETALFNVFLFFAFVINIESFKSAITILKLSFKKPNQAGDATYLQEVTRMPSGVWGMFFAVQAAYFVFLSLSLLLDMYKK